LNSTLEKQDFDFFSGFGFLTVLDKLFLPILFKISKKENFLKVFFYADLRTEPF